jgi:exodeoxyribonuclease VII large subunit
MNDALIYSVSDITHVVKMLIEENIPAIWVEGEISNFKAHYSGHLYFTLKDENAQLSAVMWKSRTSNLSFTLEDGMLVQAYGNITLYEKSGRYQIDIIEMQPAGRGRLQAEFERLKHKLEAEGLFDVSHKKSIPRYPNSIGIVTSETGAALQDILNILKRRAPQVNIILRPVKVQGEGAAREIAEGVRELNIYKNLDLIIVGRGGGSLEDLWAFNEEIVARAIYNSEIPVITAVGHEIDFTISDFVSDLRAPTPSAAAELSVPDRKELIENLLNLSKQLEVTYKNRINSLKEKIQSLAKSYGMRRPVDILHQYALQIDNLTGKLEKNFIDYMNQGRQKCEHLKMRLDNLNPKNVLRRGYSLTYYNGALVKSAEKLVKDAEIVTEFYKGAVNSKVTKIRKNR